MNTQAVSERGELFTGQRLRYRTSASDVLADIEKKLKAPKVKESSIKAYLSGKIGNNEEMINATFDRMNLLSNTLMEEGIHVLNPFFMNLGLGMLDCNTEQEVKKNKFFDRTLCYKFDIQAVMECDRIYALDNWVQSPGAVGEVMLAINLGKEIYIEDNIFGEFEDEPFQLVDSEKLMKKILYVLKIL